MATPAEDEGLPWVRKGCIQNGCQPPRRSGHSLSLVKNKMWVFGGCTAGDASTEPGSTNNLYSCDIGKKELEWTIPDATVRVLVCRLLCII